MAVKTYDNKQVVVTWGPYTLNGFGPDSKVTVTFNDDMWLLSKGVDGEDARSKSNNNSARVSLPLMQTSASNDVMSAQFQIDLNTNGGALPLEISDTSGRSLFRAESAWIVQWPESEFSGEVGVREWILETGSMQAFVGGNS